MSEVMRCLHMIGNAHIDPVWMWRWQEGYSEVMATFSSALERLKESPYIYFSCSSAAYYKWVEEANPEMFNEIKKRVEEGRWVIVSGWWIQPDCNLPSGESFVRQSLYAQRYFLKKFGRTCKTGYNVDSFGHSVALPQILKKSGMNFYVMMRPSPEENHELPFLFWWQSPDGSKVLTYKIPFSYNNSFLNYKDSEDITPLERKIRVVSDLAKEYDMDMMCFFGIGNHGGGPTKRDIALIERLMEESNLPDSDLAHIIFSNPDIYFESVLQRSENKTLIPVWKKDLLHHATGCYSSYSKIKKDNRIAENRLMQAEKFAAAANVIFGDLYPGDEIRKGWENVLFNQFHDIMGGCSIKSAYKDAEELHGEALSIGARILNKAVQKISWNIDTVPQELRGKNIEGKTGNRLWDVNDHGAPVILFNPLSWDVEIPVRLDKSIKCICDDQGNILPRQEVQCERMHKEDFVDNIFFAKIPAFGYSKYTVFTNITANPEPEEKCTAGEDSDGYYLENELIRIEFDKKGYITSMYDKKEGVNVFDGPAAVPVIIDDRGDAWGHNIVKYRDEIGRMEGYEIKITEKGPLRSCIRVKSRYERSEIWQDFMLYSGKKDIFVDVKLDWHEKSKMLKLSFPVNIKSTIATYEIPYGCITREANGEEMPGQTWIDVTGEFFCEREIIKKEITSKSTTIQEKSCQNETLKNSRNETIKYGVAIANDSKYAYEVFNSEKNSEMRLTVTRSPIFASHFTRTPKPGEDYEYIDEGIQYFKYMIIPHCGSWQDARVVKKSWELNNPPFIVYETYHEGPLPGRGSFIKISKDNIIATVFKKAEDSENYILRCYEAFGEETEADIELYILNKSWKAKFYKNEIKTFLIPADGSEIKEVNLIELEEKKNFQVDTELEKETKPEIDTELKRDEI
ncbi:MAG TPA: alpha-mannosidase [Clostridiaceae bacterium]|nr:alpha-mannosidase [Clostridiaceae bacterium]